MRIPKPLTIFLVDDEPFSLDLYRQYLIDLGHLQVITFSNNADCLEQLRLHRRRSTSR